jgi:hypothetical protein
MAPQQIGCYDGDQPTNVPYTFLYNKLHTKFEVFNLDHYLHGDVQVPLPTEPRPIKQDEIRIARMPEENNQRGIAAPTVSTDALLILLTLSDHIRLF